MTPLVRALKKEPCNIETMVLLYIIFFSRMQRNDLLQEKRNVFEFLSAYTEVKKPWNIETMMQVYILIDQRKQNDS